MKDKLMYPTREERDNPFSFCVRETAPKYKSLLVPYYHDHEHAVKLFHGDCIEILNQVPENCVDMIFADPPYFLSNGGITCHAGKMVPVHKGNWDKSRGVAENHEFNLAWLQACQRVLKPNGTIWVSGTAHIIFSIGYAMQQLGFKILNDIIWQKRNPPPNLSCRCFTHSTEVVIWAAKNNRSKHYFDYPLMKELNNGKQMKNVWTNIWTINAPTAKEKTFGKHPTQKPVELLLRIISASTKEKGLVLDPFCGSSSTGVACCMLRRNYVGIEKSEEFLKLSSQRLKEISMSPKKFEYLIKGGDMNCENCGKPLNESFYNEDRSMKSCPNCSAKDGHEHVFYPYPNAFGTTPHRSSTRNPEGPQSHCTACRSQSAPHYNSTKCSDIQGAVKK